MKINKNKFLSFLSIILGIVIIVLLNMSNNNEKIKVVIDVNNDLALNEEVKVFVNNLKKAFENNSAYEVILVNKFDGEDFLFKRWALIEKQKADLVINFDNNYILNSSKMEIFVFPTSYNHHKNSLKLAEEISETLLAGKVDNNIFYVYLNEIKKDIYHVEKIPLDSELVYDLSLDIFEVYKVNTIVISNNDFNNASLIPIYVDSINKFFDSKNDN